MVHTHLVFDTGIGRKKPENIVHKEASCPFCDRRGLSGVLAEEGPILWLKNKYPVFPDAYQTVLVESYTCEEELSTYAPEHLQAVIGFGLEKWRELSRSGQFRSVLFFKNHGPCSGGSMRHPHMLIVGLDHIDYQHSMEEEAFQGIPIWQNGEVEVNLSTRPRVGFFEFNILLQQEGAIAPFAHGIQSVAHYILNHFHRHCSSYNLFFYESGGAVRAKMMPRFVLSPVYVGYGIPQVSSQVEEVAEFVRTLYFAKKTY